VALCLSGSGWQLAQRRAPICSVQRQYSSTRLVIDGKGARKNGSRGADCTLWRPPRFQDFDFSHVTACRLWLSGGSSGAASILRGWCPAHDPKQASANARFEHKIHPRRAMLCTLLDERALTLNLTLLPHSYQIVRLQTQSGLVCLATLATNSRAMQGSSLPSSRASRGEARRPFTGICLLF
jgi:hypothetical protein